jgi:hypothetical protein
VKLPEVVGQGGHWHVEYIRRLGRGRGVRAWEIGTEQKRPWVDGYMIDENDWLYIDIESRPESWGPSLYFRDGEDGSVNTQVRLMRLPRRPVRRWVRRWVLRQRIVVDPIWTVAVGVDKYAVQVVAVRL